MRTVNIGELKDRLSAYLGYVRQGRTVVVLDRDRAIAQIIPVAARSGRGHDAARLDRLEGAGVIRRGSGRWPGRLLRRRPIRLRGGILAQLRKERESGW